MIEAQLLNEYREIAEDHGLIKRKAPPQLGAKVDDLTQLLGLIFRLHPGAASEGHGALHGVLELPHVARPLVWSSTPPSRSDRSEADAAPLRLQRRDKRDPDQILAQQPHRDRIEEQRSLSGKAKDPAVGIQLEQLPVMEILDTQSALALTTSIRRTSYFIVM